MLIVIICIGLSFLVGHIGKDRKIGFGWAFGLSLVFSPIVGLIAVLISKPKTQNEVPPTLAKEDKWSQLEKLSKLKADGAITEEEFDAEKKKLLN